MKIFVISHKKYNFPKCDYYVPLKVGVTTDNVSENELHDAMLDNIAYLNPYFCELTAAYWIWKNIDHDIVGLVHYRRYFSSKGSKLKIKDEGILSSDEIQCILSDFDIIVPKKRNYYITTIKNHYIYAHKKSDFHILREVIINKYPGYIDSFDIVMNSSCLSLYNMFIGKKYIIDKYFSWLFPLLFELEPIIDYKSYDSYQRRVFGFMAERLFNVWLDYNAKDIKIKYVPIVNIEGENILYKGINMLKRHIWSKK